MFANLSEDVVNEDAYQEAAGEGIAAVPDLEHVTKPGSDSIAQIWLGKTRKYSSTFPQRIAQDVSAAAYAAIGDGADDDDVLAAAGDAIEAKRADALLYAEPPWGAGNHAYGAALEASGVLMDWVTEPGACDVCAAMPEGNPYTLQELPMWPGDPHPNCFPAGTMVSLPAAALGATVREYVGDVITIRTAFGDNLTGTPNHPIATRRGWIRLAELKQGDEVLCRRPLEARAELVDAHPHVEHVQAAIEQVAESLPVLLADVPTGSEDFHGDGTGSEVHVVRAYRELLNEVDAFLAQMLGEGRLVRRHVCKRLLNAARATRQFVERATRSADGIVRGNCEGGSLVGRSEALLEYVGLRDAANLDPSLQQAAAHGGSADAEGFCDRVLALAGEITASEIVSIERVAFSGHVYNLETECGWYVAGNIIAHNCRCHVTPDDETWQSIFGDHAA